MLNQALTSIGLESWTRIWLGVSGTVLNSIVFVDVYKNMGITMLLCFTAVQFIPKSIFEACKIEGIGYVRQFIYIVLPLIRPIIQLCVVLALVAGLNVRFREDSNEWRSWFDVQNHIPCTCLTRHSPTVNLAMRRSMGAVFTIHATVISGNCKKSCSRRNL